MNKQARNAPCACGSGKKYKKCCYLNPPSTGVRLLHVAQDRPQATEQTLRPSRHPALTAALLALAVSGR